jgi:branched-chain amino acid transport system substrate-binding protein
VQSQAAPVPRWGRRPPPPGGASGAGVGDGGGPSAATRSPIKLGSFGTQSGPIGLILANAVASVRAWVADINARGGLNGHPVQLIMADDGGDPGKALAIARRMVEEEKILAFYGLFGAATLHTAVPYVEQHRVPVIGSVPHPAIEYSPVFFAPETTNVELNRGHLTALRAMSPVTRLSLMACREADSCPKAIKDMKDYAAKLNFSVVHEATVSLAQPDYTAEVLAARNAGAQAVVLVLDVQSVVRFLRSAQRQEWRPVVLGGPAVYEQAFLESGGSMAEGTLLFATTLPYSASPRMAPYREAVARWVPGGKLGDFGAGLWLGGKLFERIAPALGEPPTRQQIFDALHGLRAETLGGLTPPLEFPPVRSDTTNHCVVAVRVEGGRYVAPNGDTFACNSR